MSQNSGLKMKFNSTPSFVKCLLIVDDDRDEHFLIKETIGESDYNPIIKTVQDGNKLMSLILNEPLPDLILLDLNMPKKSGIECLCDLRASAKSAYLPIVVLSTSTKISDIEACYANGANLFFSKPYDFESLKKLIYLILSIDWSKLNFNVGKADFIKIASEGSVRNFSGY